MAKISEDWPDLRQQYVEAVDQAEHCGFRQENRHSDFPIRRSAMLTTELPLRLDGTVAWRTLPVQERNPKRLCQYTGRAHRVVDLDSPETV